jgi:4-amino-4-deoxy-L-arabinose transferase-like glycosyltransferase
VTRGRALAVVAAVAAVPRLVALLHERGDILASFTEKSDDFASTFIDSGTYGFVPGLPSAWTQPLYGWFLIPIYWVVGRSWWAVGLLQILVAVATAWLVYEIGRRYISPRAGLAAAIVSTLNPYLVWHDVHVNREILDQLLAAAIVLLTLLTAERRSWRWAAALGAVTAAAVLGNTRLTVLPLVLLGYLAWRLRPGRELALAAGAATAAGVLVLLPWPVRNAATVGCFTLTTDTKALWKANNLNTYRVLAGGGWIDDVPNLPGAPLTPEQAAGYYKAQGRKIKVDECAQMRLYRGLVRDFVVDHPGAKAKLAGQALRMQWDPRTTRTTGRSNQGGALDRARRWAQPLYMVPLYVLAAIGLFLVPRPVGVLLAALLGYQTLAAMAFVGATRYRVAWDLLLALLAGAAIDRGIAALRERRTGASAAAAT